jgi:hypothetical protein
MKTKNIWVDLSILSLCIVAILGFILRSKILFSLPWINYLYLLDVHSHFAFEGWVTLALIFLFVQELLPESLSKRSVYRWLFGGIVFCSFGILFTIFFINKSFLAGLFSVLFILITYVFSWIFLKDVHKARINNTARLLSVSAIVSLLLSSAGPIALIYLHSIKPLNPFLRSDALYVYLHLQYNGFFTLAVFALLFHQLYPKISKTSMQNFHGFSVLLCISILPSLFLSFLWQNPTHAFRIMAMIGSILIFICTGWFIVAALSVLKFAKMATPAVRNILFLSIAAFNVKMFLQSFTIFPAMGNAVFGDRPVIIGFLHLVFLGFVSPFILAWYVRNKYLNIQNKLTVFALIIFILGVAFNEITLMLQGLGVMFLKSSYLFPWLLWGISIWLVIGAILIFTARIRSRVFFHS